MTFQLHATSYVSVAPDRSSAERVAANAVDHRAQLVEQRTRLGRREVDEHEPAPRVDAHRVQGDGHLVVDGWDLQERGTAQRAIEPVASTSGTGSG